MQVVPLSNTLTRLFRFCLLLMGLFFVINVVIGYSVSGIHSELKEMELFLELAQDVKPNFERSLTLYTQGAEEAIGYVKILRPSSETEYIDFISSVENIGDELSLGLELDSIGQLKEQAGVGNTLNYRVRFFGGQEELLRFLSALEALPYYIRVDVLHYETLELAKSGSDASRPNIDLTIALYVQ